MSLPPLRVFNSFSRTKEEFRPLEQGRKVSWYICGPTVYDSAHLGHARAYVGFDVVRRIMEDYFGYEVVYVMNVTDIDDKLIVRARDKGKTVAELASFYEAEFFQDMKRLGVRMPTAVVRVTEYVPEVVQAIATIIENGYAYESNGSVYFNTVAFSKTHTYRKLVPSSTSTVELDAAAAADGEGMLSDSVGRNDKKNPADFALWKRSKEGEVKWPSPWGEGRPGWHIECTVLGSELLGQVMDIHSGGVDLRFPHHDNEVAQAEALFESQEWVRYFLHAGHLEIKGLKMSKSLKNFITISGALEKFTARQLRFLFLLHNYGETMDYSTDNMELAQNIDKLFSEFIHNVKSQTRSQPMSLNQHWGPAEKEMNAFLEEKKKGVDMALRDNFDTATSVRHLQELVRAGNVYMQRQDKKFVVIRNIGVFVSRMLKVFGVIDTEELGSVGGDAVEERLGPVLDVLMAFRNEVKAAALRRDPAIWSTVLTASDSLRNDVLPELGVRLEDQSGESPAAWKLEDRETLLREREQKRAMERQKAEEKRRREEELQRKEEEKLAQAKISPFEMMTSQETRFSRFDEKGLPTHDADGKELSKNARKKAEKEFEKQEKLHKWYLDKMASHASSSSGSHS